MNFRRKGIGSSDSPVIMKVSPFKTPLELWQEKLELKEEQHSSFAMERGKALEPKARAAYELINNTDMPPTVWVHDEHPQLIASLDGYNEEIKKCLEIKCVSREDHAIALKGSVPEKYYPQLQHQLLVTGTTSLDYFSFDGERGTLVEVKRDESYIQSLLQEELKFWELVKTKTPPPFTEQDIVPITDADTLSLVEEWKQKIEEFQALKENIDFLRLKIEPRLAHKRNSAYGVRIQRVARKGAIDYAKIPELQSVDLERYRKAGSEYFLFSLKDGEGPE